LPPELFLLAQICTKSFVGWGFAPDPTGGAYSAPPDPLAGLRGPTSKGGEGRGGKGSGGKGRRVPPLDLNPGDATGTPYVETFVCAQGTWQGQIACEISASYLYASCSYANMYFP